MKKSRFGIHGRWLLLCLLALLVSGCGTANLGIHVTYTRQGDTTLALRIESTGMMEAFISEAIDVDGLREAGWEVETVREGELTRQTAAVTWPKGHPGASAMPFSITEAQGLLTREYEFRMDPADWIDPAVVEEAAAELEEGQAELIDSMLKMTVSVTLPGDIIENNADNVQESTANWYPRWSDETYPALTARSREIDMVRVGILAGVLVCILAIVIVALVRRRKRQTESEEELDQHAMRLSDPNEP